MNIDPEPSTAGAAHTRWDPKAYLKFARLRELPAQELLDHIGELQPKCVYDLGCGTGIATQLLARRWPKAKLIGVDSSAQMLREARCLPINALWQECDVRTWHAEQPADVLFAAAVLHFIRDHESLLPRLLGHLKPGGCLAVHMPDWRDAPWYQLMLDTLERGGVDNAPLGTPRLRKLMAERSVLSLEAYYRLLAPLTTGLDIWETEHLQVVEGQSPIFDWVKVSALRPVLQALKGVDRQRFLEQYLARVHRRYPREHDGHTLFPFKRVFIVATL